MPDRIQQILFNLETAPPPDVWEVIAERLDKEYDAKDIEIAQKISSFSTEPPKSSWQVILEGLENSMEPESLADKLPIAATTQELVRNIASIKKDGKVISLGYRRAIIAAIAVGFILLGSWYFLTNWSGHQNTIVDAAINPPAGDDHVPVTKEDNNFAPSLPLRSSGIRPRPGSRRSDISIASHFPSTLPVQEDQGDIQYASMSNIQPVNISRRDPYGATPARVSGPLIRDHNGHIILDLSVIRPDENNFITVTGPNGEQTRISAKFLPFLIYLNSGMEPQEYIDMIIHDGSLWKKKFQEWRNKLQNASFAPSGSNFLDILELKDLLNDGYQ